MLQRWQSGGKAGAVETSDGMSYNARMAEAIYDVLTAEQVERLAQLITMILRAGHGSVTIRVKRGRVRFVSVDLEGELRPDGAWSALDDLIS